MKRVAIFGNAGGGKSTLARRLSELTGLPLHQLDLVAFKVGGGAVPHEEYLRAHAAILANDSWIIEGYGCTKSSWERFGRADTLVYLDLPLPRHYWWVMKRCVLGLVRNPEGWPERSPVLKGSLSSLRIVWPCHKHLTPRYRELVAQAAPSKRVHHLKSARDMEAFLARVAREMRAG